ncbi:MAG: hypothetical protein A2W29_01450, partial [Gemmatimonadetes bacterium RBG_16_66_8]
VPEITRRIGGRLHVIERGALDGLSASEIAELAPRPGEQRLVTRLKDGREVVVSKQRICERVQRVLDVLPQAELDLTVLLCTGHLPGLRATGLFLEAQHLVDHGVAAIAQGAGSIGVMVPLEEQIAEFHFSPREGQTLRYGHASPYSPGRLERAARELAEVDVIVMHCIGYTEEMRQIVTRASGRPVLLARRLVAAAISQLI